MSERDILLDSRGARDGAEREVGTRPLRTASSGA